MNTRTFAGVAAAAAIAVGAYWYWSPLLALHRLQTSARAHDAEAFNDHVDYPKLRESVKGQVSAVMAKTMGDTLASKTSAGAAERAGASLGSLFALAMADKLVDAMVRPETVMRAMEQGKLARPDSPAEHGAPAEKKVDWTGEHLGVDKYIVHVKSQSDEGKPVAVVLERDGFAHWRVTEFRLPAIE